MVNYGVKCCFEAGDPLPTVEWSTGLQNSRSVIGRPFSRAPGPEGVSIMGGLSSCQGARR